MPLVLLLPAPEASLVPPVPLVVPPAPEPVVPPLMPLPLVVVSAVLPIPVVPAVPDVPVVVLDDVVEPLLMSGVLEAPPDPVAVPLVAPLPVLLVELALSFFPHALIDNAMATLAAIRVSLFIVRFPV